MDSKIPKKQKLTTLTFPNAGTIDENPIFLAIKQCRVAPVFPFGCKAALMSITAQSATQGVFQQIGAVSKETAPTAFEMMFD
jgi:hypothetical protein